MNDKSSPNSDNFAETIDCLNKLIELSSKNAQRQEELNRQLIDRLEKIRKDISIIAWVFIISMVLTVIGIVCFFA